MSHAEREFDDAAKTYAAASKYPWKRAGVGIGGSGASWDLTTNDADDAPQRETRFSVALDEKTDKVLMSAFRPLPPMRGLFDHVVPCPFVFNAYESADEAMSACEAVFDMALCEASS